MTLSVSPRAVQLLMFGAGIGLRTWLDSGGLVEPPWKTLSIEIELLVRLAENPITSYPTSVPARRDEPIDMKWLE